MWGGRIDRLQRQAEQWIVGLQNNKFLLGRGMIGVQKCIMMM